MANLFSPFTLREVKFRNRIGMSPMCQYSAVDGFINAWHLVHLGSRASGGAGLIIVEATAVSPEGRISPRDLGIWSDDHIAPYLKVNDFIRSQGAVPGIQIAHAGRKASCAAPADGGKALSNEQGGWEPVAPSPLAFDDLHRKPRELEIEEIHKIQDQFAEAAARANAAEFEFLEIHAAHGYLIHSFLSPLTNEREDEYGGSFENRIRFLLELVDKVRSNWPDNKPLGIRLSCTDWVKGGWDQSDSLELSNKLKWKGVDLFDCSSGAIVPNVVYPAGASWQVPFAAEIRRDTGVASAAVGMITEPMQADAIIRNDRVDIVLLGRELLRNPYWPLAAAQKLGKQHLLQLSPQYEWVIGVDKAGK